MSQSFVPLAGTDTLTASRSALNNNADALLTSFSGTAFPVTNIAVGMTCYRTDLQKTFRLRSTGPAVWVQSDNLNNSLNFSRFQYTATQGQTTFTGADKNGLTLAYTAGFAEVAVDGVWLAPDDYTATDGTSLVLNAGTSKGQSVYLQCLAPFNVVDVLTQSQNGADVIDKPKFRANIGVTKRNYIVNGGMMVSQENGTSAGTTVNYYPVDQFFVGTQSSGAFSAAQVASPTPGGSPNRLRYTVTTADAAVATGDLTWIMQSIEGLRGADLLYGASAAKAVTLQFGVKAPAGTYCVAIRNALSATRSFVGEFTISGGEANTDVVKSVTIPGDQAGTWLKDNGLGMVVSWCLMAGATFQTTGGAWQAGSFLATSNQFNFMGTNGNVFELFDVSLTEGTQAPAFQLPDYPTELALCKRYWEFIDDQVQIFSGTVTAGATHYKSSAYTAEKRALPTLSGVNISNNGFAATVGGLQGTVKGFNEGRVSTSSVAGGYFQTKVTANARM
ncbi:MULTISPECIES: hypothetical protein [unclassified Bradyrhizobium]|uniref:hypothetical protein n=1 Tax=unclassified Bradyrhizobium TaxID=2631580 RepID=UPI003392A869